jgi:hypothetical protein
MRKWSRLLIAGIVVSLLGLYPLLAPTPHRIDEAHFDQIQFGAPAGNYDWAVAKDPAIVLWDVSTGLIINEVYLTRKVSSVTINRALDDATAWDITFAQPFQELSANIDNLTVIRIARTSRTWTSRHGTGTIHFDQHNRVTGKSGWGETRLEPPWHSWRKWFSK